MNDLLILVPLAVLGLISGAVLTAADTAHLSTSRQSLDKALRGKDDRVRERVLRQHDDSRHTIAVINLGRVIAQAVMAVAITASVFDRMPGVLWPTLVAILITSAVAFVGVSVSPRTLGRRFPERLAIDLSGMIALCRILLGPFASVFIHIGSAFTPGGRVAGGPYATEAELRHSVERAVESEALEVDERDMIKGVFDLGDTLVREVMVPRTSMITISADTTAEKAIRLFVRSGYSRIPVTGDTVDDLLGMLYVKDVTRVIHSPWDPRPDRPVTEIMRPARFIPEFLPAGDLLRDMQTSRVHIAVVVDEYGGISGIVTIEDLLEEIVGEIADEHDRAEPEIEDLGEGVYRVPARTAISEVGELFNLDIDDDDVDTIGGLLGKTLERVPIAGAEADTQGLHMAAERFSGRRKQLATVLVSLATEEPEEMPEVAEEQDDHA